MGALATSLANIVDEHDGILEKRQLVAKSTKEAFARNDAFRILLGRSSALADGLFDELKVVVENRHELGVQRWFLFFLLDDLLETGYSIDIVLFGLLEFIDDVVGELTGFRFLGP